MLRLDRVFSLAEDVAALLPPDDLPVYGGGDEPAADGGDAHDDAASAHSSAAHPQAASGFKEPHRWAQAGDAPNEAVHARRLKIVGQEKGGLILYAYDAQAPNPGADPSIVTVVEMFELASRRRSRLFMHTAQLNVVNASINVDRTLLLLTTCARVKSQATFPDDLGDSQFEDVYETYFVEIAPHTKLYPLSKRSRHYQRAQFLDSEGLNRQNAKQARMTYHVLFIQHTETAQTYTVQMELTESRVWAWGLSFKAQRLSSQPKKDATLAQTFLWYQWDLMHQTLYVVYTRPQGKELPVRYDYVMRVHQFHENGRHEVKQETALPFRFRRDVAEDIEYFHLPCSRSVPDVHLHLEVVRLDASHLCVCLQTMDPAEAVLKGQRAIHVTVFLLPSRVKVDITIPMNNASSAVVALSRVHFTCLDGMLLVYLPGHYLHIIDASGEHEPADSLILSGAEFATPLPDQVVDNATHATFVSHMEVMANDTAGMGHTLYDCHMDRAYRYTFSEECILALFGRGGFPAAHVPALHLALVHSPDASLALRLLRQVCDVSPNYATAELFKEFLTGATYVSLRQQRCEPAFLRGLPVTTIPSYDEAAAEEPGGRRMTRQASAIDELSLGLRRMTADTPPLLRRGVSGLGPARFSFDAVSHLSASSSHLMLSPAAAASPPGPVRKRFDQFLGRFFSSNPADGMTTAVARPAELGDEDDDPVVRQRFTDALAEHLASVAPREPKARAIHWARAYTQAQYQQTAALWAVLSGTPKALGMDKLLEHFRQGKAPDPAWSVQLQLLENLYSALEELHFPAPAGFHTALAVWAFHCLPRHVVLQYLDRKILRITEAAAEHIVVRALGTSNDRADCHFKARVLAHLRSKTTALRFMRMLPEHNLTVVEHDLAKFFAEREPSATEEAGDAANTVLDGVTSDELPEGQQPVGFLDIPFIPLSVFVHYAASKGCALACSPAHPGYPMADATFAAQVCVAALHGDAGTPAAAPAKAAPAPAAT